MPNQVVPIQDIAKAGVIIDTPSVSLPPNVFSDVLNVRFDDNAIRKMEGESTSIINIGQSELIYVAWWPHPDLSPTNGYYVVVANNGTTNEDNIYLIQSAGEPAPLLIHTTAEGGDWQHTLFGGGRTLIMNNGISTPHYITDVDGEMYELPGWDSYLVDEELTTFIWSFSSVPSDGDTSLGVNLDINNVGATVPYTDGSQEVVVTIVPADPNIATFTAVIDDEGDEAQGVGIGFDISTDSHFLTFIQRQVDSSGVVTQQGVENGDTVNIQIRTIPEIRVRAKVIRTFGNLLIAGNLTETMRLGGAPVRNMPGLIRTSDVAVAGNIPANWNPFHTGVNTADEFTLSSTGIVQDMAELQGVMFVYTNNSIHSIQATGNASLPYNVRPVAEGYGAQTINAVREFDGKHVVIGSNDIYVFSGHPGSIQSISDGRVRKYFYDHLDMNYEQNLHTLLNRREDELWISFPHNELVDNGKCTETLIWNYRDNTWTRRRMTPFYYSDVAPLKAEASSMVLNPNIRVPIMTDGDDILQADQGFTLSDGATEYSSYVERQRLAITPEFDTETLASVALLVTGTDGLNLEMLGTSTPNVEYDFDSMGNDLIHESFTFTGSSDYKTDVRIHGRFLNYRIGSNTDWQLSGMQYEIRKGGQR